mgnify:CR=1 FL=1|tara:strand:- start:4259 stop:5041 length:783 start_codon:yes stop_codon:yes gene_type:complete
MPAKRPEKLPITDIKSKLLNISQTSQYLLSLTIPQNVTDGLGMGSIQTSNIELLCSNANLPGSSLATHEVTNDYHGVTERMAYRRIYDETFNTSFYVDRRYNVIKAFEGWINYISGVDSRRFADPYINARYQYPGGTNGYKKEIYLTKFEKDFNVVDSKSLVYCFQQAFPLSITAMPVSYDQPDILKCSVNFSFMRYNIKDLEMGDINIDSYNNSGIQIENQYSPEEVAAMNAPSKASSNEITNSNAKKAMDPKFLPFLK